MTYYNSLCHRHKPAFLCDEIDAALDDNVENFGRFLKVCDAIYINNSRVHEAICRNWLWKEYRIFYVKLG